MAVIPQFPDSAGAYLFSRGHGRPSSPFSISDWLLTAHSCLGSVLASVFALSGVVRRVDVPIFLQDSSADSFTFFKLRCGISGSRDSPKSLDSACEKKQAVCSSVLGLSCSPGSFSFPFIIADDLGLAGLAGLASQQVQTILVSPPSRAGLQTDMHRIHMVLGAQVLIVVQPVLYPPRRLPSFILVSFLLSI